MNGYLVLSRKVGEKIDITAPGGQRLEIVLAELRGDKARIGIAAPKDFRINRREITEAIDPELAAELDELQRGKGSAF